MIGSTTYDFTIPKKAVEKYLKDKREETVISSYFYTDYLIYDQDFYMYHPVKVFDDNPETGWLDGKEGAGTGSSIGIVLDRAITIDEIRVAPGYFDRRWYKDNNRVKDMRIRIRDDIIDYTFKDEMVMQRIACKKKYTFYEIEFLIKDIYWSKASDDTAISEIQFFNSAGCHKKQCDDSRLSDK
jgi:hypothetical protein